MSHRIPKVKVTLTIEGIPWERFARHLERLAQTKPDDGREPSATAPELAITLDGHPIFAGLLASIVHAYPSSPPHAALPGAVVKAEGIEWALAPAQQRGPLGLDTPPAGGEPGGGGSACGRN